MKARDDSTHTNTALLGIRSFAILLTLTASAASQEAGGSFQCESHTVAIDRLPNTKFALVENPNQSGTQRLLQADFSGFDHTFAIESVRFVVLFTPEHAPSVSVSKGTLRILAKLSMRGSQEWRELVDADVRVPPSLNSWYDNSVVADLLHVFSKPPEKDDGSDSSDDPLVSNPGRPQIQIQQAENGQPVFLMKFIRLIAAGGHGEVETEQAIVLDLRAEPFRAPAAVGCIKNDFASEQHDDEWINCKWNAQRHDYICKNNSASRHAWSFSFIIGERLPARSAARR